MASNPADSSRIEAVGVGAATLDDLWLVPSFSDEEGVIQASQYAQMGGGPVATALCVLACLGQSVALVDAVGDDENGAVILKQLAAYGVSLTGIRSVMKARSARAVILVRQSDGARQIAYLPSTCGELQLDSAHVALIRKARLLHINGRHEQAAREAVAIAAESGALVSFDGGAGRYRDSLRDLVDHSHIKILSMDFARHFCGSGDLEVIMAQLFQPRTKVVVITDGMNGSYVALPGGQKFHQPAFHVQSPVDTTGCGDIYHGAFLHGWLQGWLPAKCAYFASEQAAKNAEGLGGRWVCQGL